MSKIAKLTAFISIVEEGGFAAAARKLKQSTASLSRQISALEMELGVQLLQRTTRKVFLTEIGAQYYALCKKTLSELTEAELAIAGSQEEAKGILRIISGRHFASRFILPTLPEFMALHPKLHIQIDVAERVPDFTRENIDLLFGISINMSADLVRRRITNTRYVLCASPQYFSTYGKPEEPSQLFQHRFITHSMRNPAAILSFKDGIEVPIQPILFLSDTNIMCECAIQGIGMVSLHDYVVNAAIQNGKLVEVLQNYQEPEKTVYLYYQQTHYLQPKIRKFIDFYTPIFT